MSNIILYHKICTYIFNKYNIDYKEKTYDFDKNMKFSIGVTTPKIKNKRKRRVFLRNKDNTIKKEENTIKKEDNIDNINSVYNNMLFNTFSNYFLTKNQDISPIIRIYKYVTNNFILEESSSKMYNLFFDIQKLYYCLKKFIRKIKYKKLKCFSNNYDLLMNNLDSYNDNIKIKLVENNIVYTFKISDLLCIINDSITNCCNYNFYPEIKEIKNPYTNLPFSLSNLYNIYFCIKNSTYITPPLFTNLFLCNFNYKKYTIENEIEIRDKGIINYYNNATTKELYKIFKSMMKLFKIINKGFIIDSEFPEDELIKIFKPFLKNFLLARYSLNLSKVSHQNKILSKKLYGFINYNPCFGRSIRKLTKHHRFINNKFVIRFTSTNEFNKKCISYQNINIDKITYTSHKIDKKINSMRYNEGYSTIPIYDFPYENFLEFVTDEQINNDNHSLTSDSEDIEDSEDEDEDENENEDENDINIILDDNDTIIEEEDLYNDDEDEGDEDDEDDEYDEDKEDEDHEDEEDEEDEENEENEEHEDEDEEYEV